MSQDLASRKTDVANVRKSTTSDTLKEFDCISPPDNNGDEKRFEDLGLPGFASFTKALIHHSSDGLVDKESFDSLLKAIATGTQEKFNEVKLGKKVRKLVNPLNAYSFQLIGNDSHTGQIEKAPRFDSVNTAIDMVERYWMALCRDISFDQYQNDPLIKAACKDLNDLGFEAEFGFKCTPSTIFRGPYKGCFEGPHVSQFLLQDFQFGNQPIRQLQRYPKEGLDYMTDLETWKAINNGDEYPIDKDQLVGLRRIITLRDGGQWVHIDLPHQAGLWATLILFGKKVPISDANPYKKDIKKIAQPFGSLGSPDVTIQSGLAGVYALKHAWFQKWCVHRRLRPEVYAQRLELFRRGEQLDCKPFDQTKFDELFGEGARVWNKTTVLGRILEHNKQQNLRFSRGDTNGSWLLPMAFPEGSPVHPAYPGGHSAFVAASATIAKAFFQDGDFPDPVVPSDDGQTLIPYNGSPKLTVHGELNKLIANVTLFRDGAGMHWRTDGITSGGEGPCGLPGTKINTGGNLLGEKLAISMLRDIKRTYRENVGTFEFNSINGELIKI